MKALHGSIVALCLVGVPACVDPVHDDAVNALPGEAPGVPVGPLHRPGQPCLTCHGGDGPADSEFSLAGTVYRLQITDQAQPDVSVIIEDIRGVAVMIGTNQAGNFYINAADWKPTFPLKTKLVFAGKVNKPMNTVINRSGSCADCHKEPPSPTSPGRIYVATNEAQLQKALARE